jgi:predicted RNA-binding protein with PUA domain
MGKNTFEKNGGYFIDGVAYMDCKITGDPVPNVSTEAKSVIGSRALLGNMTKMFPETEKPTYKPTGRPAGWHFMNEFVDKDGNVFHKGVEQPKLKGTLKPTKVVAKKKAKRRTKEEILIARQAEKKAALKKAVKKQKDFINHKFGG